MPAPFVRALALVATLAAALPSAAQGTCGAAGGDPSGSVCDLAREAAGLPAPGPGTGAGNPVDVVTGNKHRREVDLRLAGPMPVVLARHYNSANRHAGELGVGWSHSFETRLVQLDRPRPQVQIVQGDGRRIVFRGASPRARLLRATHASDGVVELPPEVPGRVPDHRAAFHWHWPDGRVVTFDASGRLAAIRAEDPTVGLAMLRAADSPDSSLMLPGGAELRFEYLAHPQGLRLARVRVAGVGGRGSGDVLELGYDDAGQLASVRRPDGTARRYRYEDPADPLRLTGVDATGAGPDAPLARIAYDAQGRAIRATDDAGGTLSFGYALPDRADGTGSTTVVDDAGRRARYRWRYDRRLHEPRLLDSEGEACDACPPAPRRWDRDAAGRLRRVTAPDGTVEFGHDAAGRPNGAWRLEAGGARTLLWRLRHEGGPLRARLVQIEQPSVAPGRLHRIRIERAADGTPRAVVETGFAPVPGPRGPRFAPIARRFGLGVVPPSDPGNDALARPSAAARRLAWIDGPLPGPADRIGLDADGERVAIAGPAGRVEIVGLDAGRPSSIDAAGEPTLRLRYPGSDAAGPRAWSAVRGAARLDVLPDARGAAPVLLRTDAADPGGRIAAGAPELVATHRAASMRLGRPTAIALPDGAVFRRGFDDFGRVAWIEEPGAPRRWAAWDEADRLVEHRPGDGSVLRHRRDAAGRLLESTLEAGGRLETLGRYRWDGPRLVEAANDAVTIRYEHDAQGRLAAASHRFAHRDAPLEWRWTYDAHDRIDAEFLPGGLVVRHRYADGRRVGLEIEGAASASIDPAVLREPLAIVDGPPPRVDAGRLDVVAGRLREAGGVEHRPDPHGRRALARAVHGGPVRAFVHDDWRLRAELDGDRLRHWIWDGPRPVALVEDGRVLRVVSDGRFAPVRVLDRDGRIAWAARYDRLGAATVAPGATIDVALRLPGQVLDPVTGLHHNHFRTYDPARGRYLEPDPLGLQPDFAVADDLFAFAGGDPLRHGDPWGLARLTWFAIGTDERGRPLGRTQGWDNARWSFLIEDILPTTPEGSARARPLASPFDGLLFDPWGDFVGRHEAARALPGNGLDAVGWRGTGGREVFGAFVAHYAGALAAPERFVIDGFDDRRAGALATILAAAPAQRASCVAQVLQSLRVPLAETERPLRPAVVEPGPARVLACRPPTTLPVRWRDDLERVRVERLQAAAEMQESPSASIGEDCAASNGCRVRRAVTVNGRDYHASYGRTQFTVTTFLPELMRLAARGGGDDAAALRAASGLDAPIVLDGRPGTVHDALALARSRVDAAYRAFPALRAEFGRGLGPAAADAAWDALPESRRAAFRAATGLGREAFVDMLGLRVGPGAITEEEGRHAIAASAAATVRWTSPDGSGARSFDAWLVGLFSSRDPYDHVSRVFLRDALRRVLASPRLAGRFDDPSPGSPGHEARRAAIETDLARRVAVLHNSGRLDLATRPDLDAALRTDAPAWVAAYVDGFVRAESRGDWDSIRCADALAGRTGLRLAPLAAMTGTPLPPTDPGPTRRALGLPRWAGR